MLASSCLFNFPYCATVIDIEKDYQYPFFEKETGNTFWVIAKISVAKISVAKPLRLPNCDILIAWLKVKPVNCCIPGGESDQSYATAHLFGRCQTLPGTGLGFMSDR